MAYPTVDKPYGLDPVQRLDGLPYAGAFRQIPVEGATSVFFGDAVQLSTNGLVSPVTNGTTATPVGVCVGGQYTNSSGQTVQGQFIPGTGVTNRIAYVVDDPNALFKVAVVSATTTIGTVARAAVGANAALQLNAGSTATGNSAAALLNSSVGTAATLPLRIIDVVTDTATGADAFTEVLVKINTHQYNSTTGV